MYAGTKKYNDTRTIESRNKATKRDSVGQKCWCKNMLRRRMNAGWGDVCRRRGGEERQRWRRGPPNSLFTPPPLITRIHRFIIHYLLSAMVADKLGNRRIREYLIPRNYKKPRIQYSRFKAPFWSGKDN